MRPLATLAGVIDAISDATGRIVAWLALTIVLVQMTVVVIRYSFGIGSILLQEAVIYQHALLFMLGAAATYLRDGHVRIDIFYRAASPRGQAWVDLVGFFAFLAPVMLTVLVFSLPYVGRSWAVLEASRETSGIPAVFLLKTAIPVFAVLVLLQGVAKSIRAALMLTR